MEALTFFQTIFLQALSEKTAGNLLITAVVLLAVLVIFAIYQIIIFWRLNKKVEVLWEAKRKDYLRFFKAYANIPNSKYRTVTADNVAEQILGQLATTFPNGINRETSGKNNKKALAARQATFQKIIGSKIGLQAQDSNLISGSCLFCNDEMAYEELKNMTSVPALQAANDDYESTVIEFAGHYLGDSCICPGSDGKHCDWEALMFTSYIVDTSRWDVTLVQICRRRENETTFELISQSTRKQEFAATGDGNFVSITMEDQSDILASNPGDQLNLTFFWNEGGVQHCMTLTNIIPAFSTTGATQNIPASQPFSG